MIMQPVPTFLRQALRGHSKILRHGVRLQSSQHNGHKEYFQNPAQIPTVAEIAAKPLPQHPELNYAGTIAPTTQPISRSRGLFSRFLRGSALSIVCFGTGVLGTIALLTWDYAEPVPVPGSEDAQMIEEDIMYLSDNSDLAQSFIERMWNPAEEIEFVGDNNGSGRHLINDVLNNVLGWMTRTYRHPEVHMTAVTAFAGCAIEGWPDTIHGGAIASLFQAALDQHCVIARLHGLEYTQKMQLNFRHRAQPELMYTVVMLPPIYQLIPATANSDPIIRMTITGIFATMDRAPEAASQLDRRTLTQSDDGRQVYGMPSSRTTAQDRNQPTWNTDVMVVLDAKLADHAPIFQNPSITPSSDPEEQYRQLELVLKSLIDHSGQLPKISLPEGLNEE